MCQKEKIMATAVEHFSVQSKRRLLGRLRVAEISDHSVLIDELGPATVVLDLGANHGRFSRAVADMTGCHCYLVEANPLLAADLATGEFDGVLHAAASGQCRNLLFGVAEIDVQSRVVDVGEDSRSVTVAGMDYSSILSHFGLRRVDLLKLDIEGSEVEFIDAMTDDQLSAIDQISVEFHDFIPLYPRSTVRRILRRMKALGFDNMSPNYGTYDILLVNRDRIKSATPWNRFYVSYCMRPLLRLLRQRSAFDTVQDGPPV
jgi:FkbM family methyltransferase